MFDFWKTLFRKLNIILLFNATYYFQFDEQSKRTNQIFEIAFRYFITKNSNLDWIKILSIFQLIFNNFSNAFIDKSSNEIVYKFKIREIIHKIIIVSFSTIMNINAKIKKQFVDIEATRFRYRIEIANVNSYANVKSKIQYNARHVFFLLKFENKVFFRFHKNYILFEKSNKKLFNQRNDFFLIKRRIKRLTYEFEFSSRWQIYSIISITQLKFAFVNENLFRRSRSNYFVEIKIEKMFNTSWKKNYEIDNIIKCRQRRFEKIIITQYLIRWKKYESKYDEWKFIVKLVDFVEFIENYERQHDDFVVFEIAKIENSIFFSSKKFTKSSKQRERFSKKFIKRSKQRERFSIKR